MSGVGLEYDDDDLPEEESLLPPSDDVSAKPARLLPLSTLTIIGAKLA